MAATKAGVPVDQFRFAHAHRDEVVWMSQNTNHLPTTPAIEEALRRSIAAREYAYYPPIVGIEELARLVLEDLGLRAEDGWQAVITAGGLEALYALNRALLKPGDEVLATDPSFLPIHQQVALSQAVVRELPIYERPWKLTIERARLETTHHTRILLLIDPINPLGSEYSRNEVRQLAELARERDMIIVHDITYRDFAFEPALAGDFAPERTLYAYSFSKNCGLAGMRIGALVGQAELMRRVAPFLVGKLGTNVLAQRAAIAALSTKRDWIGRVVAEARENQRLIADAVRKFDGLFIPVYPSSSNTLCIDTTARGIDPEEIERRLLFEHKVFVRAGSYLSKRFGPRFVRVSFTVPREGVQRFLDAFPRVVEELTAK